MDNQDQTSPVASITAEPAIAASMQLTAADVRPVDFNQARELITNLGKKSAPFILTSDSDSDEQPITLERFFEEPHRARGIATIKNPDDFIEFVRSHKRSNTELFYNADDKGARFVAVLNAHEPDAAAAGFGWHDHRVNYTTETSRQWKTWQQNDGKQMPQKDFCDFIESNRLDFTAPEASELLKITETMSATESAAFTGSVRLQNGDMKLSYEKKSGASAGEKGELTVPDKFTIGIPVFLDDSPYAIEAHFRYRIAGDGKLYISYQLITPEHVFEFVTNKLVQRIREGLNLPIYRGTPIDVTPMA